MPHNLHHMRKLCGIFPILSVKGQRFLRRLLMLVQCFGKVFCLFVCGSALLSVIVIVIIVVFIKVEMEQLLQTALLLLFLFGADLALFLGDLGVVEHLEIKCLLRDLALFFDLDARLLGDQRVEHRIDRRAENEAQNTEQRTADDDAEQYPKAG